jgi:hypothetical protein
VNGVGPKNRVAEPVTGAAAITFMAAAISNKNYPAAIGYAILAVVPWITSWLADRTKGAH